MSKDQLFFDGKDKFSAYAKQESGEDSLQQSISNYWNQRTFVGHDTNISVKSDYGRGDYEYFRPSELIPKDTRGIISMCMEVYRKVGIVRNIIDLMSDFGAQGIRIQHTNSTIENFYNRWFNIVRGKERSERFLNNLYRTGNVIIKKNFGHLKFKDVANWKSGKAVDYDDIELERIETKSRKIPLRYIFLNPLSVEVIGGDLSTFVGKSLLAVRVSSNIKNAIKNQTNNKDIRGVIDKIPNDIRSMIEAGHKLLPLPPEKVEVFYFKKDDWQIWADPMVYPILNDLIQLEKMKLADSSALDGAISNIRLWRLGVLTDNPTTSILPTRAGINKLRNILSNNVGGGVLDLVWGPELDFKESASQVHHFLGPEKYQHTMNAIYEGMGVPPSLRSGGTGSNTTGNFVGLNTLVKRLQYGRDLLVEFWDKELRIIHDAMGFPGKPPVIIFDYMVLADEAAEKQLIINLWDRDIIPTETVQELFGRNPGIENQRLKKEADNRGDDMPEKASPFHNPDKEHEFKKILIQSGQVTPSEIGLELEEKKEGEETMLDKQQKLQVEMKKIQSTNKTGIAGRPKNKTETKKRKPKPKGKGTTRADVGNMVIWAKAAQEDISSIINPALLDSVGKKNFRQLTDKEFRMIENIKFNVLSHIEPYSQIDEQKVYDILTNNYKANAKMVSSFENLKADFIAKHNRDPNVEELRNMSVMAYVFALI